MSTSRPVRARVVISGRVQGVSFRYSTYHQAWQQGVVGWVRNLPDGRVEAVFEGNEAAVERVVAWCRHGPPGAFVDATDVTWGTATGEFAEFNIERTPLA